MVSVVIPTFNRGRLLGHTLDSLLAQRADVPFEIVVVDNNSSDDTRSVIEAFAAGTNGRVRCVVEQTQGSSAARNAGIAASTGAIIAFVDDDIIAHPGWLAAHVAAYRDHPDAWCIAGRVVLGLPDALPAWFDPEHGLMPTFLSRQDMGEGTRRIDNARGFISANLSVRREAIVQLGAFHAGLGRFGTMLLCGEDVEFCRRVHRAGKGVYYCGWAVVTHMIPAARLTRRFFRERAFWQGRTDALLHALDGGRPTRVGMAREGIVMLKDTLKAMGYSLAGSGRRALEHELAARKRLGYLRQALS